MVRQHDGGYTILAGNHTADALEAEGLGVARCEVIECSDDEAARIAVADNRLSDIADDDDRLLAELLATLDGDLEGTGWTVYDLDKLADGLADPTPPEEFPPADDDIETEYRCPMCSYEWSGKAK